MFDRAIYDEARREFLAHLRYTKGHRVTTCYAYHSDLGIWRDWLQDAGKDWQRARVADVEQWTAWQLRERRVSAHLVNRRPSALSSFYRWALRHEIVDSDPVYLADKLQRPQRIPVWLEKEEQARLTATLEDRTHLPLNLFDQNPEHLTETRRRYEVLFGLLLNSGLRISEALGLKVADVRRVDGAAKSVRVIGKGDKERLVPLPAAFGAEFGDWLKDRPNGGWVFAKVPGQPPASAQAARAYPAGDAPEGRDRQEDQPAQAAPHLRHQSPQRRGGPGGHQGPAGAREHQHHADLHQRRPGVDGAGGGAVVR